MGAALPDPYTATERTFARHDPNGCSILPEKLIKV